jgi:hypothetical protein
VRYTHAYNGHIILCDLYCRYPAGAPLDSHGHTHIFDTPGLVVDPAKQQLFEAMATQRLDGPTPDNAGIPSVDEPNGGKGRGKDGRAGLKASSLSKLVPTKRFHVSIFLIYSLYPDALALVLYPCAVLYVQINPWPFPFPRRFRPNRLPQSNQYATTIHYVYHLANTYYKVGRCS